MIWPPCGTVLTGGMHDDLTCFQRGNERNLPDLIAAGISRHHWTCTRIYWKVLFAIHQSFALLLCFSFFCEAITAATLNNNNNNNSNKTHCDVETSSCAEYSDVFIGWNCLDDRHYNGCPEHCVRFGCADMGVTLTDCRWGHRVCLLTSGCMLLTEKWVTRSSCVDMGVAYWL